MNVYIENSDKYNKELLEDKRYIVNNDKDLEYDFVFYNFNTCCPHALNIKNGYKLETSSYVYDKPIIDFYESVDGKFYIFITREEKYCIIEDVFVKEHDSETIDEIPIKAIIGIDELYEFMKLLLNKDSKTQPIYTKIQDLTSNVSTDNNLLLL